MSQTSAHKAKAAFDRNLLNEISGHIYYAVEGFFEKYFENKSWSPSVGKIVRASTLDRPLRSIPEFVLESPTTCLQGRSIFQSSLPGVCSESAPLHASSLFLVPNESACDDDYTWADVQVVGQFEEDSRDDYLEGFLRLYAHAREVFISQPTRLFLHGFYVFGSMMELWMFGRSGLYSCEHFDVTADRDRLLTIIAGYQMMSDSELEINALI
jgi:hypothetical protein